MENTLSNDNAENVSNNKPPSTFDKTENEEIKDSSSIFDRERVQEYEFMRDILYQAENYKEKKQPDFERRYLKMIQDYLSEYMEASGFNK